MAILLRRSGRADWLRHCVGLSVLSLELVVGSASATTITYSKFPPNPNVMPGGGWQFKSGSTFADPPPPRAWVNGVYGGVPKTVATDIITVAGRAGNLPITATSAIGLGDAAAAVARCLIGANLICAAGTAAAIAYANYRFYPPDSTGPARNDPGVAPTLTAGRRCQTSTADGTLYYLYGDSVFDAVSQCTRARQEVLRSTVSPNCTVTMTVPNGTISYDFNVTNCVKPGGGGTFNGGFTYTTEATNYNKCPASIDPTNPAYNVPAGSPVGPDGKCPTARYNHIPATETAARDRVTAFPPIFPNSTWRDAVKDSIDSGGQSVPSDITTSGPASQTGTPTQTVTTQGTTTTTTTNTPTYNYTYNGDTVTYNTTNVTNTTINNNGTITTTTTTTTGGSAAPQDPTDPCTANPDRIGCKTAGTVAPQPDLYTKKTKTFDDVLADFKAQINATPLGTATHGFFTVGGGGTCPTWSAHIPFIGADVTLDQFCSDFASNALALLKTALLVVSSLVAFRVAVL